MNETHTPPFNVLVEDEGTALEIKLRGELDVAAARYMPLVDVIGDACGEGHTSVVINVSELHYCDSSGVRELLTATQYCAGRGIRVRTVGAAGIVRRVFEISDVGGLLGIDNGDPHGTQN